MDIRGLRDKFLSFLFPVLLVAVILGTAVWIIGITYFWDTSRLSVQILSDKEATVSLSVDARLVYVDTTFFGFPYSIHLTLPWSTKVSCASPCMIDHIPSGEGVLVVQSEKGDIRENILITPDTSGTIDLKPKIIITPVTDEAQIKKLQSPVLSPTDRAAFPSDPIFSNTLQ